MEITVRTPRGHQRRPVTNLEHGGERVVDQYSVTPLELDALQEIRESLWCQAVDEVRHVHKARLENSTILSEHCPAYCLFNKISGFRAIQRTVDSQPSTGNHCALITR